MDTAYGIIEHNEIGPSEVVHKVPIDYFKKSSDIEKIRDSLIRSSLIKLTNGLSAKGFEQAVLDWCEKKEINSIRIVETISIIPIKDKDGKFYKGYSGRGNAYMEIFENSNNGNWESEIISRFNANQIGFVPDWRNRFPTAKLKMRIQINDLISVDGKIFRIHKLSGRRIYLAPDTEANVAMRDTDKNDDFKLTEMSASKLQKKRTKFVHISPTGLISEE